MSSLLRTKVALTGIVATLALGCQDPSLDDESPLSQEAEPSIDGGLVAEALDAAVDDDAGEVDAPDAGEPDAGQPDAGKPPSSVSVHPRDAPFFAAVTANGTGCPRGTWGTDITPDGDDFTLTFSNYEVEVEDGKRTAFKDCNLTVKLSSTEGLSFAVSDFFVQGYAFLEEGVRGFQTANAYFQGNPIPSVDKEKRTDLTGPVDRSYLFQDVVRTADAVWSPCGLNRNLQIVTRIGLQKSQNKGYGYMQVEKMRGPKLSWRKCR